MEESQKQTSKWEHLFEIIIIGLVLLSMLFPKRIARLMQFDPPMERRKQKNLQKQKEAS